MAITYQPDLMLHLQEGLPLLRFGTLIETPLNSLVVLQNGPVQALADLKGKTIGYSVAGFEDVYVAVLLESVGLTMSDVTLVNVNFNLTASLMAGQVDAVIGAFRNFELTQLALEGAEGFAFFPEENGVPPYDELIYATSADKRDDPRLGRFLLAVEEATIFLTNHPDDALDMFLEAYPKLDIDVKREQELLLEHDAIVFQFPFYWYSTPPILKQWQDLVLEHGWAYGSTGNALQGKTFGTVLSAGGTEAAYCSAGKNRFTVRQLLAPIEQTAMLCGMKYLPPLVIFGTHLLTEGQILERTARYRAYLDALVAGEPDDAERQRLAGEITINRFVASLVGSGA